MIDVLPEQKVAVTWFMGKSIFCQLSQGHLKSGGVNRALGTARRHEMALRLLGTNTTSYHAHHIDLAQGVVPDATTQRIMDSIGRHGAANVESAQVAAAALSAVFAAAGGLLMRAGMF
jgi:hypothetical protein